MAETERREYLSLAISLRRDFLSAAAFIAFASPGASSLAGLPHASNLDPLSGRFKRV